MLKVSFWEVMKMPKPDPRYLYTYDCRTVRETEDGEIKRVGGKDSKRLEYHEKKTTYTVCRVKWKKKQNINEAIDKMTYDELEDLVRRCVLELIKSQRILKSSGNVCPAGLIIPPKES